MANISRREFLKRTAISGAAAGLILSGTEKIAEATEEKNGAEPVGTFIDLTRCDGCPGSDIPACVNACRQKNKSRFPEPVSDIPNNWPQKTKEDWSGKREIISRLTPYNWTFVQKTEIQHNGKKHMISIPRRCMHCTNPPCANLCPFSAQSVTDEGAILINQDMCLGGAKCRDVCPWGIPARQAGVGLYMKMMPGYVGGGVMYKCDLCIDRIKEGKNPSCVDACPKGAFQFGSRAEMLNRARNRAKEIDGYIYGEKENGGTSTFYVSPVPFEEIDKTLQSQREKQPEPQAPGYPGMPVNVENYMDTPNGIAAGVFAAPIAGVFAAGYKVYKTMKGEAENDR